VNAGVDWLEVLVLVLDGVFLVWLTTPWGQREARRAWEQTVAWLTGRRRGA
jgi:hypothetical protein